MTEKIDTLIFDLDGTLLNTLTDLTNSVNHVMELHNMPLHTETAVCEMIGNGIRILLEKAIPQGHSYARFEECVEEFQKHYEIHKKDFTKPFPGIIEFLKEASASGYRLAIVSNKFDLAVKGLCQDFFSPFITTAIGESSAIARKPAPDTLFQAMKELGATPADCLYVGDSDVDIATAQNAGIPCISVSWGFRPRNFLVEHGACFIADTVDDLKQLLSHDTCLLNIHSQPYRLNGL